MGQGKARREFDFYFEADEGDGAGIKRVFDRGDAGLKDGKFGGSELKIVRTDVDAFLVIIRDGIRVEHSVDDFLGAVLIIHRENEIEAARRHLHKLLRGEAVGGVEIAVVEIVIGRRGDGGEFDGAIGRLGFGRDADVPAGKVAGGSDGEAELEIAADVVDVGFAAFDFAGELDVGFFDGRRRVFGLVMILGQREGESKRRKKKDCVAG